MLSSEVDSVKEGESLLFMSLRFHLICHNATSSVLAQKDVFSQSMYQEMSHNQGRQTGDVDLWGLRKVHLQRKHRQRRSLNFFGLT